MDGSPLEGDALERSLRSNREQNKVVFELQVEFSSAQVRKLKEFFRELFDAQPAEFDGKTLGLATADAFTRLKTEIADLGRENFQLSVPRNPEGGARGGRRGERQARALGFSGVGRPQGAAA